MVLAFAFFYLRANERLRPILSAEIPSISQQREAKVVSAFFGLDNALPLIAIGLSWKAPGKDGMPVVFSQIHPFQIADLSDNDNNIDLCIDKEGIPIKVSVKADTAMDPRDDANDFTSLGVAARW